MTAVDESLVRSPLSPPPDLPGGTDPGGTRVHDIDARRWRLLRERAARSGVGTDALVAAVFADTLRLWAKGPEFSLACRIADGPGGFVEIPSAGLSFADRAGALHAALDTVEPAPAEVERPFLVGPDASATGRVRLACAYDTTADGLRLRWEAAADAFPSGLLDAAFAAFTALVDRLADDEAAWREHRPATLPDADRALVDAVNDTDAEVPGDLLHEIVARRAAERPHAEAVVDGRRRLSYGELASYANRIGRFLRGAGVRPGQLVGVVMEKGWEQYAAVYGILTSGAAYLPVDAGVPAQRLARLLRRGEVRHVLTQSALAAELDWPDGVTVHAVDRDFEAGDDSPLPSVQRQTDLAYVIWTSGSTGDPKGVMVDHRGVVNLITDVNSRFGVGERDRIFGISGLHFDASVYDVFGVLAAGGTVVLPDPFERARPDEWTERVRAEGVTLWNSVPAIMETVVGQAEIRDDRPLASLRLAVLSGDWIPLTLPDRLRAQAPDVSVVGSGGPSETICWSVFYRIGDVDPAWTSIPYGKPISNQRYLIVDEELRRRPVWAHGQMAVVSDVGLARGYLADPAHTAARFVTLPETGERAYLTGDLGRYRSDGNIEILGREDHQVKIQGYRIELGEIEAALREQPGVTAAVVVAPASERGMRRLRAYVVGEAGLDPRRLRAGLREVLPSYMVPASVEVLEALPLTRNGKVDRRALASGAVPAATREEPEPAPARTPATPLESVVCALMGDILGGEVVEPSANFLRLGGDSLSGARLAFALRETLGVEVPLRTVFDNPVVADLAAAVAAIPEGGAEAVATAELLVAMSEEE